MVETCHVVIARRIGPLTVSERVCGAPAEFTVASAPEFVPKPICVVCAKKVERAIQCGEFHAPPSRGGYFERGEVVLSRTASEGADDGRESGSVRDRVIAAHSPNQDPALREEEG